MAPAFIQRARQRAAEAADEPADFPGTSQPGRRRNPFMDAAHDLAADWEAMVVAHDNYRDEAERTRGENVYLSGKVDELTRELERRAGFYEIEIDRLTKRADRAVEDASSIRAKMEVIAQALRMVLDEDVVAPRRPDPAHPPRDYNQTPPQGHPVDAEAVQEIGSLISRLAPVEFLR